MIIVEEYVFLHLEAVHILFIYNFATKITLIDYILWYLWLCEAHGFEWIIDRVYMKIAFWRRRRKAFHFSPPTPSHSFPSCFHVHFTLFALWGCTIHCVLWLIKCSVNGRSAVVIPRYNSLPLSFLEKPAEQNCFIKTQAFFALFSWFYCQN